MSSSSLGLCLTARPVRGLVLIILDGLGWPILCRALALTALAAENFSGLRFFMASMSMKEVLRKWKSTKAVFHGSRELETMEERDFFSETTEERTHTLICPKCGQSGEYKVAWVVRRKLAQLPRGADERDRAKFAKAQSYMVRRDEKLACANIRCRKPFEITTLQSVAFLAE